MDGGVSGRARRCSLKPFHQLGGNKTDGIIQGNQLARGQIRGMIGPRRTGRSAMIPGQVARHLIRMSLGQQRILGSGIVPRQRRTSRQIRTSRQHGGLRICARRRVTRRRGLGGHRARLMVEPDPQRLHRTDFGRSLERVDRRLATTVGAHGMTMTARRRLVAGPRQSRSTRSTSFRATTTMVGRGHSIPPASGPTRSLETPTARCYRKEGDQTSHGLRAKIACLRTRSLVRVLSQPATAQRGLCRVPSRQETSTGRSVWKRSTRISRRSR